MQSVHQHAISTPLHAHWGFIRVHVHVHVHVKYILYMYVYIYMYMCMYTYMYTYMFLCVLCDEQLVHVSVKACKLKKMTP